MSERYYSKYYDELYYIFDSHTVSEEAVDERIEYDGYNAFEDSLTDKEILKLLNENDELKYNLSAHMVDLNNCKGKCSALKMENERLKQELFEARRDYLIETADISDKLYLEEEIEKERKEIFGDITKEDVEKMAKKALKHLGHSTNCPECGADITFQLFWFDCHGRAYRNCPKCNARVRS